MTPGTVTHEAPLSTGFSRQEYWSGLPCPPSGGLPDPGIGPGSPAFQADGLPSESPGQPMGSGHVTFLKCISVLPVWETA